MQFWKFISRKKRITKDRGRRKVRNCYIWIANKTEWQKERRRRKVEREIFMHISYHHSVSERDVECFVVTQQQLWNLYKKTLFIFSQMNTKTRQGREREREMGKLLMLLLFCSPSQRMSRMKKMREKVFFVCVCCSYHLCTARKKGCVLDKHTLLLAAIINLKIV